MVDLVRNDSIESDGRPYALLRTLMSRRSLTHIRPTIAPASMGPNEPPREGRGSSAEGVRDMMDRNKATRASSHATILVERAPSKELQAL